MKVFLPDNSELALNEGASLKDAAAAISEGLNSRIFLIL